MLPNADKDESIRRIHFDSGREYHAWMTDPNNKPNSHWSPLHYDHKPADIDTGLNFMLNGNDDVEPINKLLESFASTVVSTPTRTTYRRPNGHRINIGAYLSGSPNDMWARVADTSDKTPLRIWVGMSSSIGIRPEAINKRGAALAAFALALSQTRQVYLTPYAFNARFNGSGVGVVSVDLQSNPLYVNELAAYTSVYMARYVNMKACHMISPHCEGGWPKDYENVDAIRHYTGASPNDLVLGAIHLNDPLVRDPIKWINEKLEIYGHN